MDNCLRDFIALKELESRIQNDAENAGWYMYQAYRLGCGDEIDEVLRLPPKKSEPVRHLRLVASNHIKHE